MTLREDIRTLVAATRFVDTHEHLLEETTRLDPEAARTHWCASRDFTVLFSHYAGADLAAAGMPASERRVLTDPDAAPRDKWRLLEPFYHRTRHTGYFRAMREALRLLFDEEDLHAGNCESVSERVRARIRPGYYRAILRDTALLHHCQVQTLETHVFQETQYPDLLCQDLSFVGLSTNPTVDPVAAMAGRDVGSLDQWLEVVDWCFATFGPRAIAAKNNGAYHRRLNYAPVTAAEAAPLFARWRRVSVR